MKRFYCVLLLLGVVLIGCSPRDKDNPPMQVIELGIPALAKDVATGSLLYEEKIVKIRGIVTRESSTRYNGISINTSVPNVYMTISADEEKQQDFSQYKRREAYTFTVYIRKIEERFSEESGTYRYIRCTLVE